MNKKDIPIYELTIQKEEVMDFEFQLMESDQPYDSTSPHRHSYFEIFYFVKGGGVHEIDFTKTEIKDQSLHFLAPGQVHLIKRDKGSHGFVVKFSREFFNLGKINKVDLYDQAIFNHEGGKTEVQLPKSQRNYFKDLFEKIHTEYESEEDSSDEILRSYLQILIIKACRIFKRVYKLENASEERSVALVRAYRKLIEQYFHTHHSVNAYASMLHISANHLSTTVKSELGKSASELIHDRIILECKRLLYHSGKSAKEISYKLGFSDPSYFSRYFKKHVGVSPNVFRDQIQ